MMKGGGDDGAEARRAKRVADRAFRRDAALGAGQSEAAIQKSEAARARRIAERSRREKLLKPQEKAVKTFFSSRMPPEDLKSAISYAQGCGESSDDLKTAKKFLELAEVLQQKIMSGDEVYRGCRKDYDYNYGPLAPFLKMWLDFPKKLGRGHLNLDWDSSEEGIELVNSRAQEFAKNSANSSLYIRNNAKLSDAFFVTFKYGDTKTGRAQWRAFGFPMISSVLSEGKDYLGFF